MPKAVDTIPKFAPLGNMALSFNGTSTFAALGNPNVLNFSGQITVEAWTYPTATDGTRTVVAHGDASSAQGFFLGIVNGQYQVGAGSGPFAQFAVPENDVGAWVHLAGTYDGANWNLYRNGVSVASVTAPGGAATSTGDWAFGAGPGGQAGLFQGLIQDVRVWNYGRLPTEIQANMYFTLEGDERGLLGSWLLNEGYGVIAFDSTPNGNNGLLGGGAQAKSPVWTIAARYHPMISPDWRYALKLDGSNDYLSLGNPPALNFGGPMTVEAWIYPETASGTQDIVAHGWMSLTQPSLYLRIQEGVYKFGAVDANGVTHEVSSPMFPDDVENWVFLSGVYDGAAWNLYRNGLLVASQTDSTGPMPVDAGWNFGVSADDTDNFFLGLIGEVRVWSKARTQAKIYATMFGPSKPDPKGLVGWWKMREGQGDIVFDATENHNAALLGGGKPVWQAHPFGEFPTYALLFDRNDLVNLGNPTQITTLGNKSFTLEAWIRTAATGTIKQILNFGNRATYQGASLYVNAANRVQFDLVNASGPVSAQEVTDGKFHHVALVNTYDDQARTNTFQLFIDDAPPGNAVVMTPQITSGAAVIGRSLPGSAKFQGFVGEISEVRIWKTALKQRQITATMDRPLSRAETLGLYGYWKFDEGAGAAAHDSSPYHSNGTLDNAEPEWDVVTNPPPFIPGDGTFCLQFDGQNDFVALGNPPALAFSGQLSIEAWVYILSLAPDGNREIVSHGTSGNELFLKVANGKYWFGTTQSSIFAPVPDADRGTWVHLAGVYDGLNWYLYRNAALLGSQQAGNVPTVTGNWAVGALGDGSSGYFQGLIQEVRVWSAALPGTSVFRNMHRVVGPNETGLQGYWRCNDGQGYVVRDSSNNHNDGTLGGAQYANPSAPNWIFYAGNVVKVI